ncbi:MAG: hypothetical protein WCY11_05570 [Novosphingobium sp.]
MRRAEFQLFRQLCRIAVALALLPLAGPVQARDSLGMFDDWGAFRDPAVPRCYAIALAQPSLMKRDYQPYATIGTWPRRSVRGQMHFRLSRKLAANARITLAVGGQRFNLAGGGADAWAVDPRMDAAIIAAMRSSRSMTVSARDSAGRGFSNTWILTGAATAMDVATIGCARLK